MFGMSQSTAQFMYRVLVLSAAAALLGIILIDAIAIFYFGDGEAEKLLAELNGPLVSAFGALTAMTVGHQVIASVVNKVLPSNVSVASPGSSGNNVATMQIPTNLSVPVNVPVSIPVSDAVESGT